MGNLVKNRRALILMAAWWKAEQKYGGSMEDNITIDIIRKNSIVVMGSRTTGIMGWRVVQNIIEWI